MALRVVESPRAPRHTWKLYAALVVLFLLAVTVLLAGDPSRASLQLPQQLANVGAWAASVVLVLGLAFYRLARRPLALALAATLGWFVITSLVEVPFAPGLGTLLLVGGIALVARSPSIPIARSRMQRFVAGAAAVAFGLALLVWGDLRPEWYSGAWSLLAPAVLLVSMLAFHPARHPPLQNRLGEGLWLSMLPLAASQVQLELTSDTPGQNRSGSDLLRLVAICVAGIGLLADASTWLNGQRRSFRRLRTRTSRFGAAVEISREALVTLDGTGCIIGLNRQARRLFGWMLHEVHGRHVTEVLLPVGAVDVVSLTPISAGPPPPGAVASLVEVTAQARDGRPVEVEAWKACAGAENRSCTLLFMRDISDRRRTEHSLRDRSRKLEASNAALEQFARSVAHDLQEPLRMVTGFLELVSAKLPPEPDDQSRRCIDLASDGARRMGDMIRSVLEFSRFEHAHGALRPIDSGKPLDDALANLRASIEASGAIIVVRRPLPMVTADFALLVSVFQNLVSNAMAHGGDQPVCVEISAENLDGEWRFRVADNGVGIAEGDEERIFLHFDQGSRPSRSPGSGLGLAIVKRVIESLAGRIWAESGSGGGATVLFTLPAAQVAAQPS